MVKRPAKHTYEMNKYFLIPENKFNVKEERRKYIKGIEMENSPDTGWLNHLKIEGIDD
jgi:hypothetical protein